MIDIFGTLLYVKLSSYYLVRIFTFGLIVYATNAPENPRDLTILLVDARHPPVASDGCPNNKHIPLLFHHPDNAGFGGSCAAWCQIELGLCQCPLERVQITIDQSYLASLHQGSCDDLNEYVPRLNPLWGGTRRVRTDCLAKAPDEKVCPFVVARLDNLRPQGSYACEMALGGASSHVLHRPGRADSTMQYRRFRFRPLAEGGFRPLSRSVSLATRMVFIRESRSPTVRINVDSFDGTQGEELSVTSRNCPVDGDFPADPMRLGCIDIAIGNAPVHSLGHLLYGRCHGHGIDRDFELFNDLVQDQADLNSRRVPYDSEKPPSSEEKKGMQRSSLCNSDLLSELERWLRSDDAPSECSGGGAKKP